MENNTAGVNQTIDKNYDSEFCGSIPLHLVNLIQPHGVLLVLDRPGMRIVQVSENAEQFFSLGIEEMLEKPLASFLSEAQVHEIQEKVATQGAEDKIPINLTFHLKGKQDQCIALIHPKEPYVLIELEKNSTPTEEKTFIGLYQHIKYITSLLKHASTTEEAAQIAAAEIKKLTGFNRVLIYRFDPQWNGIVIAQEKEEDMEDYLGLRFPASDVPKQARDLYLKNPYRLIPTRAYEPKRLIPIVNPLTQRFTDLSDCNLRSVAAVHLEYLSNMQVMASMSLPLIIDDQLWGLISCHHQSPYNLSYEMRSALELLSGIISAQIVAKEKEQAALLRIRLRNIHAELLRQLYSGPYFVDGLLSGATSMHDLLSLSGAAVLFDGNVLTSGKTPDTQDIKELVSWLRRNKIDKLFATDSLMKYYGRSKDFKELASGLITLPINPEQGEYILGFRPEVQLTVNWGGNPHQAIQMEPDGKSYHPRHSFAVYNENVKETSLPWLPEELEVAETLRSAVLEKIIKENY